MKDKAMNREQNAESKLEQAIDIIKTLRQETTHVYGHCDPGAVQDCWNELQDIVSNWQSLTTPASNEPLFRWVNMEVKLPEEGVEVFFDGGENPPMFGSIKYNGKHPSILVYDSSGEEEYLPVSDYEQWLEAVTLSKPHTVEEGQTQEPVGGMKNDKEDVIRNFIRFVSENEYFHVRSTYGEFWYKNGRKDTPSTDEFIKEYLHVPATPPPAPIKTEGEDAEQAAANWQKQNEKYMPDEQSESMLYDSFMAGVEWKSKQGQPSSLPQSSTEEEKNCRAILTELVYLKNLKDSSGKTEEYEQRQPLVWITAKKFLEKYQNGF